MSNQPAHPFPKQTDSVRLLTYWTRRYVLVLLASLALIAMVTGYWVRTNAYEHSLQILELRANSLAELSTELLDSGQSLGSPRLYKELKNLRYVVQVADEHGKLNMLSKGRYTEFASTLPDHVHNIEQVLGGTPTEEEIHVNGQTWLRVGVPIVTKNGATRALYISQTADDALPNIDQLYGPLALLIGTVATAGWFVIYFLSRKLTKPLLDVAQAAQTIADGSYDLNLPLQVKERELQALIGSFHDMAARLEHLEQVRTDLLAGVSHELRTPITSIRGMIQAVQSKVVTDEEADEFLQISLDETKRLQRMVEELLSLSSLEAGATPLELTTTVMTDLLEEVIQQLRPLPAFAHLLIEKQFEDGALRTTGDASQLRQILLNLLNNSANACGEDGMITVRLQRLNGQIALDIEDTGSGIPEEDQSYIFERFYRAHKQKGKKSKPSRGLGIGLTISRLIARAHGGDLVLLASSPEGSTFRLLLPLEK